LGANVVTLARMALAVITLVLFQLSFPFRVAAFLLTILVFYMDSLDGWMARKFKVASDFGALFDITADRIVEHVYWIFFSALNLVSYWVPIIFVARSFLVDAVRSVAFSTEGRTPFGEKTMMRSDLSRFLTAGRFMRGLYGFLKLLSFLLLGAGLVARADAAFLLKPLASRFFSELALVTPVCVWITTALCLVRGLPVLWDGRVYLLKKSFPREMKDAG